MDNKELLFFGGILAVGAWFYFNNQTSTNIIERQFRLPSGRVVFESQLPKIGYTKTPNGWVNTAAYNLLKGELSKGFDWNSAINTVTNAFGEIKDVTGQNNLSDPFSTPSDWGLSSDGGVLAGVRQVQMKQQDIFSQIQF